MKHRLSAVCIAIHYHSVAVIGDAFILGNLSRNLPFHEVRLTTEGMIHVTACLCTLLVLLLPSTARTAGSLTMPNLRQLVKLTALTVAILAVLVVAGEFGLVRGLWGSTFAGHGGKHIRFGPDATIHQAR